MLEFDVKWFVILLGVFLGLMYVLTVILFRPLIRVFDEREENIGGSLKAAKEMDKKKEEAIASMKQELSEASKKAKGVFEELKAQGLDQQRELLAKASGEASGLAEKARAELRNESENARTKLRSDVERFSEEIVRKLTAA